MCPVGGVAAGPGQCSDLAAAGGGGHVSGRHPGRTPALPAGHQAAAGHAGGLHQHGLRHERGALRGCTSERVQAWHWTNTRTASCKQVRRHLGLKTSKRKFNCIVCAVTRRTLCGAQVGMVREAEEAFTRGMTLQGQGASNAHAMRAMAEMRRGCGRHGDAIRLLDKALEKNPPREAVPELAFLRGDTLSSCMSMHQTELWISLCFLTAAFTSMLPSNACVRITIVTLLASLHSSLRAACRRLPACVGEPEGGGHGL